MGRKVLNNRNPWEGKYLTTGIQYTKNGLQK
jgi:hypothetical protein